MGVDGWQYFADANDIEGEPIESEDTMPLAVDVDVLGMFYWPIVSILHRKDHARERIRQGIAPQAAPPNNIIVTPQSYALRPTGANAVLPCPTAQEVDRRLRKHFDPKLATIHVDGPLTLEKKDEHERRNAARKSKVDKCKLIAANNVKIAPQNKSKQAKKCWKQIKSCRTISDSDKTNLVSGLKSLQWKSCEEHPSALWKVLLHYRRERVLGALDIDNDQMNLLAIISKTDFAKNVKGMGLARNLKVIKSLPTSKNLTTLHKAYEANVKAKVDTKHSRNIFMQRQETPLSGADGRKEQRKREKNISSSYKVIKDMVRAQRLRQAFGTRVRSTGTSAP
ncbi:hypothetical protein BGX26_001626, partial [Mortierella sp. AD094]